VYGPDIYTEPPGDPTPWPTSVPWDRWQGVGGDEGCRRAPVAEGTERDAFVEHYELEPIDRQTNGPQLFYGMRYHTHITKPGETETFHDRSATGSGSRLPIR